MNWNEASNSSMGTIYIGRKSPLGDSYLVRLFLWLLYFDAKELHAHQEGDDGLGGGRGGLPIPEFLQLGHEPLADGMEARLGQDSDHLRVEVRDDQHVGSIRTVLDPEETRRIKVQVQTRMLQEWLLPFSVFEILERQVFDIVDQVLVTRVDGQLFEDFDENQAENKLDGQIPPFHMVVLLRPFKDLGCIAVVLQR